MSQYQEMQVPNGVPVKMWTHGVPVEAGQNRHPKALAHAFEKAGTQQRRNAGVSRKLLEIKTLMN